MAPIRLSDLVFYWAIIALDATRGEVAPVEAIARHARLVADNRHGTNVARHSRPSLAEALPSSYAIKSFLNINARGHALRCRSDFARRGPFPWDTIADILRVMGQMPSFNSRAESEHGFALLA